MAWGILMTESFKPYEPEDDASYEYAYDDYPEDDRRRPSVKWGRIIALLIVLLLAFWLGRATAGGVDETEVRELRSELAQTRERNAELEDQVAAAQEAAQDEPEATETPDAGSDEEPEESEETEEQTYTVERGDTLRGIAQTYCGDPDQDDVIAAANDIDDATQLSVGQTLILPSECSG